MGEGQSRNFVRKKDFKIVEKFGNFVELAHMMQLKTCIVRQIGQNFPELFVGKLLCEDNGNNPVVLEERAYRKGTRG